jgi:hypothetical protein
LLVGVLAWAGWDAYRQAIREEHYRAGQQAAQSLDWDRALAHYSAALGYKDAKARVEEATRLIAERDSNYSKALSAVGSSNWPQALQALQAVERIQPHYRDTPQLSKTALAHVAPHALKGAVALHEGVEPAGLYYHTGEQWVYLQGSDRSSRVLGYGTSDHLVYGSGGGHRSPMVAHINGSSLRFEKLAFITDDFDYFVWGKHGVWGLSSKHYPYPYAPIGQPGVRAGYAGFALFYQAFGSPAPVPVLRSGNDRIVMDLGRDGRHMLLAETSTSDTGGLHNKLYIINADSGIKWLLYEFDGGFQSAKLSPDGRHVLLVTFVPHIGAMRETHSAVLIDVISGDARTITRRSTNELGRSGFPAVSALWLTKGPLAGKALIGEWGGTRSSIILLDPDTPTYYLTKVQVRSSPLQRVWAMEYENEPKILLVWQNGVSRTLPYEPMITFVELTAGRFAFSEASLPLEDDTLLVGAWLRGNHIIYRTRSYSTSPEPGSYTLYSLPCSDVQRGDLKPTAIYEIKPVQTTSQFGPVPFNLGRDMLVYSLGTEVHARTYDGAMDLKLDTGVSYFYDPFYDTMRSLLR